MRSRFFKVFLSVCLSSAFALGSLKSYAQPARIFSESHYQLYAPITDQGEDVHLVLVPGMGRGSQEYQQLAQTLQETSPFRLCVLLLLEMEERTFFHPPFFMPSSVES